MSDFPFCDRRSLSRKGNNSQIGRLLDMGICFKETHNIGLRQRVMPLIWAHAAVRQERQLIRF
jgi:hypothetical protein